MNRNQNPLKIVPLKTEEELNKERAKKFFQDNEFSYEKFMTLPEIEREELLEVLFKAYSENINVHHSLSTLEYILMSSIRILSRKVDGYSLSEEDLKIERALNGILKMHDITNRNKSINEWPINYMAYAQHKSVEVLKNREKHQDLKNKLNHKE